MRPFIDILQYSKGKYRSPDLNRICTEFLIQNFDTAYKIYTDASKDNNRTGAAFFDPQTNNCISLNIETNSISIMNAELIAIAEALSYITSLDTGNYVVFSDSRSSLQHILRCTTNVRGSPIAYSILQLLRNLVISKRNIVLQWIPSHIGLRGNEAADQLAKKATSE